MSSIHLQPVELSSAAAGGSTVSSSSITAATWFVSFVVIGLLLGLFQSRIKRAYRSSLSSISGLLTPSQWDWCFSIIDSVAERLVKALGPLLVVGCTGLILFVTFSYFYDLYPVMDYSYHLPAASIPTGAWRWYYISPVWVTVVGVWLLYNILWNYLCCVFVHPGRAPAELPSEVVSQLLYDPEVSARSELPYRYCRTCKAPKPMRTHHCGLCGCCVLKADHHCVWINQCVGHYNQRYFILFLFYMLLGTSFFTLCSLPHIVGPFMHKTPLSPELDALGKPIPLILSSQYYIVAAVVCVAGWFACGGFIAWTIYLAATNQTTIEFFNSFWGTDKVRYKGKTNPYNLGPWRNMEEVFGSPPLLAAFSPTVWLLNNDMCKADKQLQQMRAGTLLTVIGWLLPVLPGSRISSPLGKGFVYPLNAGRGAALSELMQDSGDAV